MQGRILVVEDERDLSDLIVYNLSREGFRVDIAGDGKTALARLKESRPDLVILDVMLPDMSGTEICRTLKGTPGTASIPIVIVSAKGEEIDRIVGLELGADDYLAKPFSVRELVLRIQAILRRERQRVSGAGGPVRKHGRLVVDDERYQATVDGKPVVLTGLEFRLLSALISRVGRVQTREVLLSDVWRDEDVDSRSVDAVVKRLRAKLGVVGDCLETVRGVGYRLREEPC